MIFALFVMPMLKVDPSEYKEFMGEKGQDRDAVAGGGDATSSNIQRLQ